MAIQYSEDASSSGIRAYVASDLREARGYPRYFKTTLHAERTAALPIDDAQNSSKEGLAIAWRWTDNDTNQWVAHHDALPILYSRWIEAVVDDLEDDSRLHALVPIGRRADEWLRQSLEGDRTLFCTPPAINARDARSPEPIAHPRLPYKPSWYVTMYALIENAYHQLEVQDSSLSLPPLPLVQQRWLMALKEALEIHEETLHRQIADLQALAHQDTLTGLLNRRGLWKRLNDDIQQGTRHAVLVLIDLDYFKEVNTQYGHLHGDRILRDFAHLLTTYSPSGDTLSRLGGDEFAWWIVDLRTMAPLRERLHTVARAFRNQTGLSFSSGAAWFPRHGDGVDPLYHVADEALYHAKESGRHRYAIAGHTHAWCL